MRSTKTEYISCPSCGRTLFDLQEVTNQIQQKTGHLPGVSIAIMGCIVNGPGEMADADFGYVGTVPGKIDLYVGREVVKKGIDMEGAPNALIELIKEYDRWQDPPEAPTTPTATRPPSRSSSPPKPTPGTPRAPSTRANERAGVRRAVKRREEGLVL